MQVIIEPGQIKGNIIAPRSKSVMQRVCAAALLHHGKTIIHSPGISDDDQAALHIIQQLGATVLSHSAETLTILSQGIAPVSSFINCGESGLSARLFTPIAALSASPVTIQGKGSLLARPMHSFLSPLTALHVSLPGFAGHVPFTVQGPLLPSAIEVDGSVSSQFPSGILFAVAYAATQPLTITVHNLSSKPYIDLTLNMLAHFGRPLRHDDYERFHIDPALYVDKECIEITVPRDWSSAAFFFAAGAVAGQVTICGLDPDSAQADKAILQLLTDIGATVVCDDDGITVKKHQLRPFDFDATDSPDLFPILSILAACCNGGSNITGVHRLFHKESNRAESISEMLQQFGVFFSIEDDTLYIEGTGRLEGTTIDCCNDHRIAMAAAIGSLRAKRSVIISGAEAVSKSYPDFFQILASIGGKIHGHAQA